MMNEHKKEAKEEKAAARETKNADGYTVESEEARKDRLAREPGGDIRDTREPRDIREKRAAEMKADRVKAAKEKVREAEAELKAVEESPADPGPSNKNNVVSASE